MRQVIYSGLITMMCATLATAQVPAIKPGVQNGVTFVSGGIGSASQEQLKAHEKEFNLKLVFTLVEGNYLSDVSVSIKNASGKTLLEHVADGPFFMAKLPAGTYSVTAGHEGKSHTRKLGVGSGLKTEYFRWASNPQADSVLPRETAGR